MFEYRHSPTNQCNYLLETTPEPHYVGSAFKTIEIILINRFGKKNIPSGNFWRLADTSKEVYGAQKYLWPTIKRMEKTYDGEIVMAMVQRRKLKFLQAKMIPRYLYWCKEEKDLIQRLKDAKPRYNNVEELNDAPVIDIEKKKDINLLDWMEEE